jgi:hypothetical protein
MNCLQSSPQMADSGVFSSQERIDPNTQFCREIFERASIQLVRDEYRALIRR